jgi:hypothetical protein
LDPFDVANAFLDCLCFGFLLCSINRSVIDFCAFPKLPVVFLQPSLDISDDDFQPIVNYSHKQHVSEPYK